MVQIISVSKPLGVSKSQVNHALMKFLNGYCVSVFGSKWRGVYTLEV